MDFIKYQRSRSSLGSALISRFWRIWFQEADFNVTREFTILTTGKSTHKFSSAMGRRSISQASRKANLAKARDARGSLNAGVFEVLQGGIFWWNLEIFCQKGPTDQVHVCYQRKRAIIFSFWDPAETPGNFQPMTSRLCQISKPASHFLQAASHINIRSMHERNGSNY